MRAEVPVCFEREVSATVAEFERDLRKAWPPGVDVSAVGARTAFTLRDGDVTLEITVEAIDARRIGLLVLPRLHARYLFDGGDARTRTAWLMRLDRAMQRGGG